jgi:hypothetical protein
MPKNYTLDVMPGHGINHLAQQLRDQNVPDQQVHNVLANFEWHADQSVSAAKELGKATKITLKLPRNAESGAPSPQREQGKVWLRRLLDRHDDALPEPLKAVKDRLLKPVYDQYSVTVNADTTQDELEKVLAEQNVSLETLQQQGFHVRAGRKSLINGTQTLTFKRYASSSGNIRQHLSDRVGKLERGKTLLNAILTQGGKAPEQTFDHFGTTKGIPAIEVSFDGTPDYQALTSALKQQGTSLDELVRHGYHARAGKQKGKITLTFKQHSSGAGDVKSWFSGHDE